MGRRTRGIIKEKRTTILVDMDDVLDQLIIPWINWLNAKHGTKVTYEDISEWDICKSYPGLTHEQVFEPLKDDTFWSQIVPVDGAVEGLKNMCDKGYDVWILTCSSIKSIWNKTEHIIMKYFPWFDISKIIVCTKKQMVKGDWLIDDCPHNFRGGKYKGIIMDAPYNREFKEDNKRYFRAYSWEDISTIVERERGD